MLPKQCDHCQHVYLPQNSELSRRFCRPCVNLCLEACIKIRRYLLKNTFTGANQIAVALGVPAVFVHHYFSTGRTLPELSQRKPLPQRRCNLCQRMLQGNEDVYCAPCAKVIRNRLHTRY